MFGGEGRSDGSPLTCRRHPARPELILHQWPTPRPEEPQLTHRAGAAVCSCSWGGRRAARSQLLPVHRVPERVSPPTGQPLQLSAVNCQSGCVSSARCRCSYCITLTSYPVWIHGYLINLFRPMHLKLLHPSVLATVCIFLTEAEVFPTFIYFALSANNTSDSLHTAKQFLRKTMRRNKLLLLCDKDYCR